MPTTPKRFSRKELYDLVWSEPMKTLAGRFGISDVALKKNCERAAIPTPDRGYWAKKDAGKETTQALLPDRPLGMDDEVLIGGGHWYGHGYWSEDDLLGPLPERPEFPEPIEAVRERVSRAMGEVKVPRMVESWHSQIERLFKDDERRQAKQLASSYPSLWDGPLFDSPFEHRRLRILHRLHFAVAKFNGKLSISGRDGRWVSFTFYQQHVHIAIDEPKRLLERNRNAISSQAPNNSKLAFCILEHATSEKARLSWEDDDSGKIENHLRDIAIEVVVTAENQCRESAVRQYEWRVKRKADIEEEIRQRKIAAERAEKERLARLEQARVDRLLKDARSFDLAAQIRGYVAAIRSSFENRDVRVTAEFENWETWAIAQADHIDPSLGNHFLDSILDEQ